MTTADPTKPLRVAFLGSANWDLVAREFESRARDYFGGALSVLLVPFGQYRTLLWDDKSSLRADPLDVAIFCERLEDFYECGSWLSDETTFLSVKDKVSQYIETITAARSLLNGIFLVFDLAAVRPVVGVLEDAADGPDSVRGSIQGLNAELRAACEVLPDTYLVRLSAVVESVGAKVADPGKYWHLGRLPFAQPFGRAISDRVISTLLSLRGQTSRLIVTDLDNTLWGGIVGEDGVEGLKIGGDFPGNVFSEIQRFLLSLKHRGMALAICSRNTESTALDALRNHPDMILRPEHFAASRINWGDKVENIRSIADELGLGLSSICFLDDSKQERELVRSALPGVFVPDLPDDPSEWIAALASAPMLAHLRITKEDRSRAESYRVRSLIRKEAAKFTDRTEYLQHLQMVLYFHELDKHNFQRVLQLLAKTNQFNLTTRRHSAADLHRFEQGGTKVIPVGLSDKHTPHEVVGVVVLEMPENRAIPASIDTFLLSCRVLGRSVETGVLGWICTVAKRNGFDTIQGQFFPTERNQPAQSFYSDHGFLGEGSRFYLPLNVKSVDVPSYFSIQNSVEL